MNIQQTEDRQMQELRASNIFLSNKIKSMTRDIQALKHENTILRKQVSMGNVFILKPRCEVEYVNVASRLCDLINTYFGVDINHRTRKREIADARRMYYHWLCFNTPLSLNEIAMTLRTMHHHSSIIASRETHPTLYAQNKTYKHDYDNICKSMDMYRVNITHESEPVINAS